jgi:hypothetical protein
VIQDQNPLWVEIITGALSGIVTAVLGLLSIGWRFGKRDQSIDSSIDLSTVKANAAINIANFKITEELHKLRLYVDEQDKQNRHEWAAILQRELSKTDALITKCFDTLNEKYEYHGRHDDERFAEIAKSIGDGLKQAYDRIWNIELRNAAKDGTLPTEYPVRKTKA